MSSATVRKVPGKPGVATTPAKKKPPPPARSPSARSADEMEVEASGAQAKAKALKRALAETDDSNGNGHTDGETGLPSGLAEPEAPSEPVELTGAESARKRFMEKFKQRKKVATQVVKTGGGSKPTVTVLGVVMRAKSVQVKGRKPGQSVPKIETDIEVLKIRANNAEDVIVSGVDGCEWLLPTWQPKAESGAAAADAADASPDGPSANGAANGDKQQQQVERPVRLLKMDNPAHKTIWLGSLRRVSFYTQKPGEANEEKEGIDQVVPGMIVEVTGVVAALDASGAQLWLNAASIAPKMEGIVPGGNIRSIMDALSRPDVMAAHAFRLSMTMGGFLKAGYNDKPELEMQAKPFRDKWVQARDGTAAACEARAMAIRNEQPGGENEPMAAVLDSHAIRLKSEHPSDLALGKPFFNPAVATTADRPAWTAGILVQGLTPEWPRNQRLWDLIGGPSPARDALPETFCAAEPIETQMQGACLNIMLRLTFIGSKAAAIGAIEGGKDPCLETGDYAKLGLKWNMRGELPLVTGVLIEPKAVALCRDLALFGTYYAIAGVTPCEPSDTTVACTFPSSYGFDMVASLDSMTVPVSEEWVKQHLALGEGTYTYERDTDATYIKDKDKKTNLHVAPEAMPIIKSHYYQEITTTNWRFKHAKMPVDAPRQEYRLWYEGVCDSLSDDATLSTDSAAAEALLEAVCGDMQDCKDDTDPLNTFLMRYCVLYCVAKAPLAAA